MVREHKTVSGLITFLVHPFSHGCSIMFTSKIDQQVNTKPVKFSLIEKCLWFCYLDNRGHLFQVFFIFNKKIIKWNLHFLLTCKKLILHI